MDDEEVLSEEVVSLRVGEREFTAFRGTWTLFPSSVLATAVDLHQGGGQVDVFIDVDPATFARVLNYLRRRGASVAPPVDDEALDDFAAAALKLGFPRLHAELALEQRKSISVYLYICL